MFGSAVYSSVKQYIDWKWWCFHIRVSIYKPKFLSYPGPAIVPFHQWLILGPCRIWTFSNAESKKISSTLFQDVICEIEIAQFCGFWSSRKNLPNFPLSVLRPFSVTGVTSHILSCIWWFRQNKPFIFWKSITLCQNMIIIWRSSFHFYLDFHPFLLRHSSFLFSKYLPSSLSDCVNQRSSRHPSQHRHTLRPIFLFGNCIVY